MMASAAVFPGQGSQRPGMGKDFYENSAASRQVYEEASDALGWDVAALCFSGTEELNLTRFAQPCILATEIAMFRALFSLYGFSPEIYAGHSLGEYTALVASGALPLADTARLVYLRGCLMQEAVPPGRGGMAACISPDIDPGPVRDSLADISMDLANINSRNQVVISGDLGAMEEACCRMAALCGEGKPFRFTMLNVSAPFHSRFMKPMEDEFKSALASACSGLNPRRAAKVASNYTGSFHSEKTPEIEKSLIAQLSGTVRWTDNMRAVSSSAGLIYEIGPGRPLRDFFKTMDVNCVSITAFSHGERQLGGSGSSPNCGQQIIGTMTRQIVKGGNQEWTLA